MPCAIRPFEQTDLPHLADIYRESIRHLGNEHYSTEQITAWASHADDLKAFARWVREATTFVAVDNRRSCIGFGGLEESGRISALFVAPEWMRQGVGSALLERLMTEIRSCGAYEATTEASEFSRPLFEKFGFRVMYVEHTRFKGVAFTRYAMHRRIEPRGDDS